MTDIEREILVKQGNEAKAHEIAAKDFREKARKFKIEVAANEKEARMHEAMGKAYRDMIREYQAKQPLPDWLEGEDNGEVKKGTTEGVTV